MNKNRSVAFLMVLFSIGLLYGCATESPVERADRLLKQEQSGQQTSVSLEEIRGEDGVRVIGYLEKVKVSPDTSSDSRHLFYVYDDEYGEVIEGMILDNGMSYRRTGGDSLEQIGFTGVSDGVRHILAYEGPVQFYRNGRLITRGSE
jgi:hypothetical protein